MITEETEKLDRRKECFEDMLNTKEREAVEYHDMEDRQNIVEKPTKEEVFEVTEKLKNYKRV